MCFLGTQDQLADALNPPEPVIDIPNSAGEIVSENPKEEILIDVEPTKMEETIKLDENYIPEKFIEESYRPSKRDVLRSATKIISSTSPLKKTGGSRTKWCSKKLVKKYCKNLKTGKMGVKKSKLNPMKIHADNKTVSV